MFADSFTIFGGILCGPVAFLGFMFIIILFISSIFAVGISIELLENLCGF